MYGWFIRGRIFGVDKKELDRFCCNWDIQLRNSSRTIRRTKPLQVNAFSNNNDMYFDTEDIECYDVLIPKDNFHALADIDKRLEQLKLKSLEDSEYIKQVMRKERIEIRARNNNPAVQKAWDNYCTLMNMVYNDYADRY